MKLSITNGAVAAAVCLLAFSCSKMNDKHQEYIDRGETIYAARVDSVKVHPGQYRMDLYFYYAAQRIKQGTLSWFDNITSEQHEQVIQFDSPDGTKNPVVIRLENLGETDYVYDLVTEDEFGNKGLVTEFSGKAYGTNYSSGLYAMTIANDDSSAGIKGIEWREDLGGFAITWGTLVTDAYKAEIHYEKETDPAGQPSGIHIATLVPPAGEAAPEKAVIPDAKPNTDFTFRTGYRPDTLFIEEDVFWVDPDKTYHFPNK